MLNEVLSQLEDALAAEREAIMRFDPTAAMEAAEQKLALVERLQGLAPADDSFRPRLKALKKKLADNHALLQFAQTAVRGTLSTLTNTPTATVYNPRGTLAAPKASLVRRVV